ncbi:MAG: sulfotransferase [Phycisphaerae bacterium]|nr:sulfotransferase [Phycisphaerae bacterium]
MEQSTGKAGDASGGDGLQAPQRAPTPTSTAEESFRPIFICGCQRSGTTALAVMFDRHSHIAVPRETQFFCDFAKNDRRKGLPQSHQGLLSRAMEHYYISRVGVSHDEVLSAFGRYDPTYTNLLRAVLECYARKQNKGRCAEKSCAHLTTAREILDLCPQARIICIVRDGRDVVRSLRKVAVHWKTSQSVPRLCHHWNWFARIEQRHLRELPAGSFTIVKYEDLMTHPERGLKRLCEFIGEEFEPAQTQGTSSAGPVQECEAQWKAKAKDAPDPKRVAAWRRCDDPELIAQMNYYMGGMLRQLGYPDTAVSGISLVKRLNWAIRYFPYRRGVFPVALCVNRVLRSVLSLLGRPKTPQSAPEPDEPDSA